MNWSAGRAPVAGSDLSREERRQGKARFDRHQTAAVAADPPSKIPITSKLVDAVRVSWDSKLARLPVRDIPTMQDLAVY